MKIKCSGLVKCFMFLFLISVCAGTVLYGTIFFGGKIIMNRYVETSSFIEKRTIRRINKFQNYISENNVHTSDIEMISEWGKNNSVVLMEIYRDHYLLYSTVAPDYYYADENTKETNIYDWNIYYPVIFADGSANVIVYADDMLIWNFSLIFVAASAGVLLALAIILSGCKRVVRQVCTLNERIQQLECGDLNVEIPVFGEHELGQLAKNLDSMRIAFKEQIEREASVFHAHQTMINEMSHDLRTPLTTIQIYTDILRYRKIDDSVLNNHLNLIDAKVSQIKHLADNIFEYSMISKEQNIQLEAALPANQVFYDLISEYIYQWAKQGFIIDYDWRYCGTLIEVYTPYVHRLLDNISLIIMKYADREYPIQIKMDSEENQFCLSVQHRICKEALENNDTQRGLNNVSVMMQKMNGKCEVKTENDMFFVTIFFPEKSES